MPYATLADYQDRTKDTLTPSDTIEARLILASEDIDSAISGAVYETDTDGNPTDTVLIDVLKRATIEQVRYLNAQDDDASIKREYSSITVAGMSFTRAQKKQGGTLPPIAMRALEILKNAGVLQNAPLINW